MTLRDLHSMVEAAWSNNALQYLREAHTSFAAGAYRASIVATWIAVVFDFIDKIHYLADRGDKAAIQNRELLRKAIKSGDYRQMSEYEAQVLDWAADLFQFISAQEKTDLERLKSDRNRCAHPSMASEHEPYRPNAELARYHLVTALETLLTRDPVHGTSFLVTLHETVSSPAFPTDVNRARSVLAHGPLRSARPTLLRNATVVFTKQVLSSDSREDASPFAVALGALHSFRRHDVEEILRAELPRLVNEADERHLELVLELCYFLDEAWPLLPIPSRAMVEELVRTTSDSTVVLRAAGATHLRVLACSRAADVSVAGFKQLQGIEALREGIVDLIVASYCRSANFSHGNAVFNVILGEVVPQLSPGHVDQIIDAVFSNSQVRGLTTLTRLLRSIARTGGGRFKPNLLAAHQRLLSLDHFDSGHLELAEVVASEFKEDIDKTLSRDEFMSIVITPVGDIEDSEFPPEEELPF